jgi:tetratricopeptide (TPR) repeat protein
MAKDKNGGDVNEAEVWSAISAFEQILEAMPNDRTSIETLAHAYQQIGDLTKAKDYLIRLADVLIGESDTTGAADVIAQLKDVADSDDKDAKAAIGRLEKFLSSADLSAAPLPPPEELKPKKKKKKAETAGKEEAAEDAEPTEEAVKEAEPASAAAAAPHVTTTTTGISTSFNIANELQFAWNLMQANELTQEEYSNVVQDLTDMSGTDAFVTVSVLHVLNDRGFKGFGKIMAVVSKECGTPIISLSNFDLQSVAYSLLPIDFMVRRGAIIFDLIGGDALAVIMNPYNKQLMKDVEALTGKRCHFYITTPPEFDNALNKITEDSQSSFADQ